MTARALLIGCRLGLLRGVTKNLDLMEELLLARGFTQIVRVEEPTPQRPDVPAATRQGILDAFAALATATQAGDAVAVYYSGHGGLAVDPADPDVNKAQFILPNDFLQSAPGDFRGVTSDELSVLLRTLTARTANVSMILDCCHSAQMVRDPSLVPLAMSGVTYVDVAAHNEKVRAFLLERGIEVVDGGRDPDAVRLVACDREQSTYEFEELGEIYGMFTFYVVKVIRSAGSAPLTWGGLVPSVQRSLRLRGGAQRPMVEGESDRLLFSDDPADVTDVLAMTRTTGRRATLDGGRIVGVEVGDRYAAVPTGDPDLAHMIAQLTVSAVTATTAVADAALEPGHPELPRVADARVLARAVPAFPVVVAPDPALDVVRTAIAASPYVRPAVDDPGEPPLARVDLVSAGAVPPSVTLSDAVGLVTEPTQLDDTGVGTTVRNVERMARAVLVRELDAGDPVLGLDVSWKLVEDATDTPLQPTGHTVFVGDEIVIRLHNTGTTTLHASVFSVDAGNAITLLSRSSPNGVTLVPGMTRDVPRNGTLTMGWPGGVPGSRPRPESLLVVATTESVNLRMLEQDGVDVGDVRAGADRLERTIHQIMSGVVRDVRADDDVASTVRHVHYLLVDAPRPRRGRGGFLLDELPDVSLALLAADDVTTAAALTLAGELAVRPDHPLHGTDLRLDVLVGTLGDDGSPVRGASTVRLTAPSPGQDVTLPVHELHRGPARGLLDLTVWLSRDTADAPPLAELLEPPAPAVGGSAAAVAAARLDALGALVDAAGDALNAAAADVTGVYRTTLIGSRGFGAGHHPAGLLGADPGVTLRLHVDVA